MFMNLMFYVPCMMGSDSSFHILSILPFETVFCLLVSVVFAVCEYLVSISSLLKASLVYTVNIQIVSFVVIV